MRSLLFMSTVVYSILLSGSCRNQNGRLPGNGFEKQNEEFKSPRDSLYQLFFGTCTSYTVMSEHHDTITAGELRIPVTEFWGKEYGRVNNRELKSKDGYHFDRIQAGIVHKYQFDKTTVWVNSASLVAFDTLGNTVKLCGEGYFETSSKPLTVLIEDTIQVTVQKNSKVNIKAYKTPLLAGGPTTLGEAVLINGGLTVINGTAINTIKTPKNLVSFSTRSKCRSVKAWNTGGAASWTEFKFDYKSIDQNEMAERLGRRFNMPVETLEDLYSPVDFTANFDEPLEQIIDRLDTLSSSFHCRLVNGKIVVSQKARPVKK